MNNSIINNLNNIATNVNYDIVFNAFTSQIKRMSVGSIRRTGIKKIAKAVMLLAVIKGIEDGTIRDNRIEYEPIAQIYNDVFRHYADRARQDEFTLPYYPFYHLHSSDFWNLRFLSPNSIRKPSTPSAAWLRNNVEYAYLDPRLWAMLQRQEYRRRLAEFIVKEKIMTATSGCRSMLRAFLGWLIAI